jgi:hypothetical protein
MVNGAFFHKDQHTIGSFDVELTDLIHIHTEIKRVHAVARFQQGRERRRIHVPALIVCMKVDLIIGVIGHNALGEKIVQCQRFIQNSGKKHTQGVFQLISTDVAYHPQTILVIASSENRESTIAVARTHEGL